MSASVSAARLRPFVEAPAPEDIAAVVASWRMREQATFLIALGAALEARHGRDAWAVRELIGHAIATEESDIPARPGSALILALADVVDLAQTVEAPS